MNFIKTSLFSGIATFVDLIARLITNKIVAIYFGTNGIFLLGQLKDLISLTKEIGSLGINNGIIKYAANYQKSESSLKELLSTGFKIYFFSSCILSIIIIIFRKDLSLYFFNSLKYSQFLIILSLSTVSVSIYTFFMCVINGIKNIKLYTLINIISTIVSALLLIILTLKYGLIGTFYAFAINQFLILLISFSLIHYFKPFKLNLLKHSYSSKVFKKLSKFSIMSITATLCIIFSTLFVRSFISKNLDSNYAGAWEGMWRISSVYLLFLITTFNFYLLPTFSKLEGINLKKEIFKIWKFTLPIISLITIVIFLAKNHIITLLFSEKFSSINVIILFHLLGDVIKMHCWVLGNVIISKAKTKTFALFQIEWALVFSTLTYLLTIKYGFIGVSYAYFLSYLIHFLLLNINFKNLLWTKDKAYY